MRLLLFLLTLSCTFSTVYATATIKGTIEKWADKTGKIYRYLDFISYEKQQIAEIQLDGSGNFEVAIDLEDYSRIYINIEKKDFVLHVKQDGIYTLGLTKKKIQLIREENTHFNTRLNSYQEKILAIAEKYNGRGKKKNKLAGYAALQTLKESLLKEDNEVLKQFVLFEITQWEIQYLSFGGKKSDNKEVELLDQLFLTTPPPYNNPYYYQALKYFLELRINYVPWYRTEYEIDDWYDSPFLEIAHYQNTIPEEAVKAMMINILYGRFDPNEIPDFSNRTTNIVNKINDTYFKIAVERIIARNNQTKEGAVFPNFQLQDKTGTLKSLSSYQSDYLLIDFWTTWCGSCLHEMKSFDRYLNKYGDRLQIISISEDDTFEKMKKFVDKKNYQWDFLYGGEDHQLARQLGVNYFPTYFILDKDRKIINRPKGEFKLEKVLEDILK